MDSVQSFLAVLLVLGLLAGTLAALRRRFPPVWRLQRFNSGTARRMELLERMSLGPHHAVHLIRIGDRSVLVATTPASCQVLETKEFGS